MNVKRVHCPLVTEIDFQSTIQLAMLGAGSPDEERLLDAAQHGDLVTVCQLAGKGTVNINCRNNQGWSPLYWAVMCNHLPVVRFLLTRFEVSLAISNNFGLTPLHGRKTS